MYVSSSSDIIAVLKPPHPLPRHSFFSSEPWLYVWIFRFFISSTLCCLLLIAVVLVRRRMSSGSKKGELSALLVCTFKSLFLFSTLGSAHTQHTNIKFYVMFFFISLFFEYAIKLFKSSTIKPQFFTSSSNARNFLCWAQTSEKLSTLGTDWFFNGFSKSAWTVHFVSGEFISGKNGCTALNMYIYCMHATSGNYSEEGTWTDTTIL